MKDPESEQQRILILQTTIRIKWVLWIEKGRTEKSMNLKWTYQRTI